MRRVILTVLMALITLAACKQGKTLAKFRATADPTIGPWEAPSSLESGSDANGAIACAAKVLPNVLMHRDVTEAFANVVAAAGNSDTVVLIGHGTAGAICTGDGDVCRTAGSLVRAQNEYRWKLAAQNLRNASTVKTLRLLSCGVGASTVGQQLLQELADDTGCIVLGPKTMVYCQNGRLEVDRGLWAKAIPNTAPARQMASPPPPPRPLNLMTHGKFTTFLWDGLPVTFDVLQSPESGKYIHLVDGDAKRLAEMIDFATPPLRSSGPALSIVTVNLTITLPPPGG
jgi:hypothetical protein